MKLGIMQPYFFPYIGYYSLIAQVDSWVVFDSSQYAARSWMNRNRIQKKGGWHYMNIPVINSGKGMKICEARTLNQDLAFKKILGHLLYYAKAPYYAAVRSLLSSVFEEYDSGKLTDLNILTLERVCHYLNLPFHFTKSSNLEIDESSVEHAGQWALLISKAMGAKQYINPIGGRDIFKPEEFKAAGIQLSFCEVPPMHYTCPAPYQFIPSLSIIDVLMWNSPEEVLNFLQNNCRIIDERSES